LGFPSLDSDLTSCFYCRSFTIDVVAEADEAVITVPGTITGGDEDTRIPIMGLSAALVDTNTDNGGEILSVVIQGQPENTRFSAGTQNGEQNGLFSWLVPVDELATLEVIPPEHFSGTMALTLRAFTFETSNGDLTDIGLPFTVEVTPVADEILFLAGDVVLPTSPSDLVLSDLALRMIDERGFEVGETAPEYVQFTYTNVPTGVRLIPTMGGRLESDGSGAWIFTGTPAQASSLFFITGPGSVERFNNVVDVDAISLDGASTQAAFNDNFRLTIDADDDDSLILTKAAKSGTFEGDDGNDVFVGTDEPDVMDGGAGSDLFLGSLGIDTMTGGAGVDVFQWELADLDGSTDTITDFVVGTDILNLSNVFVTLGVDYDPQDDFDVNDFLSIAGTTISLNIPGNTEPVVDIAGVTGFTTLTAMFDAGSILL
jgi:Ca2+-binding RTX toxin-like protein